MWIAHVDCTCGLRSVRVVVALLYRVPLLVRVGDARFGLVVAVHDVKNGGSWKHTNRPGGSVCCRRKAHESRCTATHLAASAGPEVRAHVASAAGQSAPAGWPGWLGGLQMPRPESGRAVKGWPPPPLFSPPLPPLPPPPPLPRGRLTVVVATRPPAAAPTRPLAVAWPSTAALPFARSSAAYRD